MATRAFGSHTESTVSILSPYILGGSLNPNSGPVSAIGNPASGLHFSVTVPGSFSDSLLHPQEAIGSSKGCHGPSHLRIYSQLAKRTSDSTYSGVSKGPHVQLLAKQGLKSKTHTVTRLSSGQGLGKGNGPGWMPETPTRPSLQASWCRGVCEDGWLCDDCFLGPEHCQELFPGLNRDIGGRDLAALEGRVDQRYVHSEPSRQLGTLWEGDSAHEQCHQHSPAQPGTGLGAGHGFQLASCRPGPFPYGLQG